MNHAPIAIIGAGLSGLITASVLHRHGISATIFELETDRTAHTQGGMLDIHHNSGQQALREAGLWDEFQSLIHTGAEAMKIMDHTATVLFEEADDGQLNRPEVDRGQLRDLLIDSLPEGTIAWGHKLRAVAADQNVPGRHILHFSEGRTLTTDLLVGGDGAWSKVRPLLTDARPRYTGISFIESDLFDAEARYPAESAVMGAGMLFAFRDNTGILGHKESDGSLHTYLGLRVAEHWLDTIDFGNLEDSTKTVLDLLEGWDPALRGLISRAETPLIPRKIMALPVGLTWKPRNGVTLIGDAAHLMSPFAGEGANLAMHDGALLALAIATHRHDIPSALAEYEQEMFTRTAKSAQESAESLELMFQPSSPQPLVDLFAQFQAEALAEQV